MQQQSVRKGIDPTDGREMAGGLLEVRLRAWHVKAFVLTS